MLRPRSLALLLISMFAMAQSLGAYSVFTHEELIDLAWSDAIQPLLLARFPSTSPAQLREAHAYAYGGCVIQDMGYYPFGKRFFSNLTHYVRSGDFIVNLFRNAHDVNEYAFAAGALSHYVGDSIGHSRAVNPATGIEFPKLEHKFGRDVTYADSPHAHIRTEFAFDIGQLSKETFAPPAYMRHIGFDVPLNLLERAFLQTYGFDIHEFSGPRFRPVLKSYRTSVRSFIPAFASAEIVLHGGQFPPDRNDDAYRTFADRLSHVEYERYWKQPSNRPGFGSHVLAVLVKILPKIGAISDLAIKVPDSQTEELYIRSVNRAVDVFAQLLNDLRTGNVLLLVNRDLDTGEVVKPGGYPLTDTTYAQLLHRIASKPDRVVPRGLRRDLLKYYSDPNAPIITKKDRRAWQLVLTDLQTLKNMRTATTAGLPEGIADED
ncbi:MAG: zinc dependent phospholipase C family protein [Acidobacteriaceae bacterium]|nr:zinc dependent phospholipase C family protein [Acidobacteriaceae bacterium]